MTANLGGKELLVVLHELCNVVWLVHLVYVGVLQQKADCGGIHWRVRRDNNAITAIGECVEHAIHLVLIASCGI